MSAEWVAERVVGEREARALLAGRFPRFAGAEVVLLATGWDNTVHLVAGEWLFRFPRRKIALPGLRREIETLPRLAPRLPLPIPVPEYVGEPGADFPWPFWGGRLIPGSELAESGLGAADRIPAATRLGEFLAALHDPGLAAELGEGLPVDPMGRADPGVRVPRARAALARLAEQGLYEPDPAIDELLAEAERLGPPRTQPVMAHGDLHIRHLIVDETGEASGVIDWGDLCLADPASDLSIGFAAFSGPARTAFFTAYGSPVSVDRELRARVLAVFLCAVLADYATTTSRPRLLAESLAGLTRAATS